MLIDLDLILDNIAVSLFTICEQGDGNAIYLILPPVKPPVIVFVFVFAFVFVSVIVSVIIFRELLTNFNVIIPPVRPPHLWFESPATQTLSTHSNPGGASYDSVFVKKR